MGNAVLRDFQVPDAAALNLVALAAFDQFKTQYSDWPAMASNVSRMSELASSGAIVVAEIEQRIVGGVAYIPSGRPKAGYFDTSWPIIRMLVVNPQARGHGVGRLLTQECIERARRDEASVIALHTTPIMTVALPMYLRMGFKFSHHAPPIYGVPYAVYLRELGSTP